MKRYIGELKGIVELMLNIDANLANKVITAEHLNHLPPTDLLYTPSSLPKHDEPYPFAASERIEYRKKPPSDVLKALRHRFRAARLTYPVKEGDDLVLWTKYHLRWKCSIGSVYSQNKRATFRRDDSYIWWKEPHGRRYGQVVIFANIYD
jgi:hypothetical protein